MFFSVFSSQKSFSLVLEALDYDNDTSESGRCVCAVCVFVCVYLCLYASIHVQVLQGSRKTFSTRQGRKRQTSVLWFLRISRVVFFTTLF